MKPTETTSSTPSPAEPVRPSPARVDQPDEATLPPKAGSDDAKNEERKTQPSRNRGVTDV